MYYSRLIEDEVILSIANNPVTAILGPRQCGKSTLARHIAENYGKDFLYLDLERPSDLAKLDDAEWFLQSQKDKLLCLDEIQRRPDLFPVLRSLVDEWGDNGHFLVLGSASRDLLHQSSESLAGRISYKKLTPFTYQEINAHFKLTDYLSRGGFPRSLMATSNKLSIQWRENFISTFLERDLLLWAGFSPVTMQKLWQMLAHLNGQILNYSNLGSSLGVSHTTVRNYIDLLESAFMVHLLPSLDTGSGKRLVKSPKMYLSDIGIANALLRIGDFEQLTGHPSLGSAWETLVINNLIATFPQCAFCFYRTSHGAEMDIVIEYGSKRIAIECKAGLSPRLNKGNINAIADIAAERTLLIAPVEKGWPVQSNIDVVNIIEALIIINEQIK